MREYRRHGVDYAYNHRPHGACDYADGFGAEILSRGLLDKLQASDLSARHREHVTLAVVDGTIPALTHACIAPKELAYPKLRFDVDTAYDLAELESIVSKEPRALELPAFKIIRITLPE